MRHCVCTRQAGEGMEIVDTAPARHVGGLAGQQATDVIAAGEPPRLLSLQHRAQQPRAATVVQELDGRAP